jgi:hypothetical protein
MVLLPNKLDCKQFRPWRSGERITPDGRKALEQAAQTHHIERKRQAVLESTFACPRNPGAAALGFFFTSF